MSGLVGIVAGSVINNYSAATTSSGSVDVVAVYDQNGNQLFSDARALKASIKEGAKLPEHTVESGYTITDNRVILPVQITLNVILTPETYFDTYQQIKQVFLGTSSVIIQTRTDVYLNQFIENMPHEETPDMIDTVSMILQFKEIKIVSSKSSTIITPKNATDASTVKRVAQQGTAATEPQTTQTKGSVAYSIWSSI